MLVWSFLLCRDSQAEPTECEQMSGRVPLWTLPHARLNLPAVELDRALPRQEQMDSSRSQCQFRPDHIPNETIRSVPGLVKGFEGRVEPVRWQLQ